MNHKYNESNKTNKWNADGSKTSKEVGAEVYRSQKYYEPWTNSSIFQSNVFTMVFFFIEKQMLPLSQLANLQ